MRRLALASLAALLLTACTGDDDASSTTTSAGSVDVTTAAPSTSTAPPTTAPPTTAPPPSSTSSPSTTTETTVPPTSPPTTEADPDIEQIRQDVAEALVASWEALDGAVRNPSSEDAVRALNEVMTQEEARAVFDNFLEFYILNSLAERTNEEAPAYIEPYPETLIVDLEAGTASMEFCFASTNRLVQIQPDGSEMLQDDKVGVVIGTDTFVLEDGRWIDSGGDTIELIEDESRCPAR